jgi:hypothetical protein
MVPSVTVCIAAQATMKVAKVVKIIKRFFFNEKNTTQRDSDVRGWTSSKE